MKEQLANYHYQQLLYFESENLKLLEKYKQVNSYLRSNDWLFISPLFFQGYELTTFLKLSKTQKPLKSKILEVIIRKFYDLKYTASFIEGYCSRCNHIKPFLKSIESSIILTFQKDYEGGIKTLIPIIEGILRKYLIVEKSFSNEKIGPKHLKNSFENIKEDIINNYVESLRNFKTENLESIKFSETQINNLTFKQREYFDVWFSFATEFINESFYLNTKGENLTNEVNRHSILHEFGLEFEYNFENYIKVYFLLQFLTWSFLIKEKKSIFNEIESFRYYEKIRCYEKIIELSEKMTFEKHTLLKNYEDYDDSILKQQFPKFKNEILPKKHLIINNLMRKFEEYLWRKKR